MLSKLFSDKKRWISVLVILIILAPTFALTKYAGEPGRIIGLITYTAIGMLGLYEVFKSVGVNKILSMILPLSLLSFMFLDWNVFNDFILYGSSASGSSMSKMIYSAFAGDKPYIKYLIILAVSIVPLLDDNYRKSKGIVIRQFIVVAVMFITFIFAKMIWVMNMNHLGKMAFFISIAVIADTFAYIGGMFFGKKWFKGAKFAPKLSPKKTWAGFVVGVSLAATFAILVGYFGNIWEDFTGNTEIIVAVLAGLFLALIAPYGDLAFSAIKRFVGVKDFSNLIPGHGGIYDRVDAMAIIVVAGSIIYLLV